MEFAGRHRTAGQRSRARVGLSWDPGAGDILGYVVYRSNVSGGPYVPLTRNVAADTSFTDGSATGGQTYFYVVTTITTHYVESRFSNEISVTVPSP